MKTNPLPIPFPERKPNQMFFSWVEDFMLSPAAEEYDAYALIQYQFYLKWVTFYPNISPVITYEEFEKDLCRIETVAKSGEMFDISPVGEFRLAFYKEIEK